MSGLGRATGPRDEAQQDRTTAFVSDSNRRRLRDDQIAISRRIPGSDFRRRPERIDQQGDDPVHGMARPSISHIICHVSQLCETE
ncbi:MAG: hypothetical protein IRY91_12985 [Gemmatimonadaceae bacterium]|nr:hypothetical protein [Gemmatimonadaceae bacterium]